MDIAKTSIKDQITFVRLVSIASLPPCAMESVSPSRMVNLQVVQENNRNIQKSKAMLPEQPAPPKKKTLDSHIFQELPENIKR